MDTRTMRWLIAIADHGSFAKAAEALSVSQPSLSNAMARLEDRLGGALFRRTPLGSELTPLGETVLGEVTRVVAEIDRIREDARLIARGEKGMLTLGLACALPKAFELRLVSELARRHPGIGLRALVLEHTRLLSDVRKRRLDVAIFCSAPVAEDPELVQTPVLRADFVPVCSPSHPLARQSAITTAEFNRYPSAGVDIQTFFERPADAAANEDFVHPRYESNEFHLLLPFALSGATTLVAPIYEVSAHLATGELRLLSTPPVTTLSFDVVTTRMGMSARLVQSVVEVAKTVGRELEPTCRLAPLPAGSSAGASR